MKFSTVIISAMLAAESYASQTRDLKAKTSKVEKLPLFSKASKSTKAEKPADSKTVKLSARVLDNSVRLLKREGIIGDIPKSLCSKFREPEEDGAEPLRTDKNVILVIGDGMGWEMIRAGAIVRTGFSYNMCFVLCQLDLIYLTCSLFVLAFILRQAKQVIKELEEMGVDTTNGSTGDIAAAAKAAFADRTLSDYYTEGEPVCARHFFIKN